MIHPRIFLLVATWLSILGHAISQVTNATAYDPELAANYSTFLQTWQETLIVEFTANSSFYATPANFTGTGPAGELLKLSLVNNSTIGAKYQLPEGLTLWRIMYTSTDLKNQTVPASGYVLAPYTPTGKTVVWTHGTSGITRDCAPSNDPVLQYSWGGPFLLASLGYTVVAPDYAGEGTDTVFNYLAGASHANDASFALKAAKAALPQLNITEWAVIGHSEGGITAWATNERERIFPTGGFLGAVSLAPAINPQEIMYRTFNITADRERTEENGSGFYTIYHFETCRRFSTDPLEPADYLTPYGLQLRELNLGGGCYPGAFSILAGNNLTLDKVWKDQTWPNSTQCTEWGNGIGSKGEAMLAKPLLVIQGSGDDALLPQLVYDTVDRHCNTFSQSPITLKIYPGQKHSPVIQASVGQWSAFLEDLFAGREPQDFISCGSEIVNSTAI